MVSVGIAAVAPDSGKVSRRFRSRMGSSDARDPAQMRKVWLDDVRAAGLNRAYGTCQQQEPWLIYSTCENFGPNTHSKCGFGKADG